MEDSTISGGDDDKRKDRGVNQDLSMDEKGAVRRGRFEGGSFLR